MNGERNEGPYGAIAFIVLAIIWLFVLFGGLSRRVTVIERLCEPSPAVTAAP